MSVFGGLVLTNKGKILQAKVQTGVELLYTRIAMGDDQLGTSVIQDLTALKHEVHSLQIDKLKVLSGGRATVGGVFSNSGLSSGFYWRELGVFAQDPDAGEILYCYGNAGNLAEYIAADSGADAIEKRIDLDLSVGNAANVSAVIDSSLVYASMEDLQSHINDTDVHLSQEKIDTWDAKETPSGAQKKIEQHFTKIKKSAKDEATESYKIAEERREDGTLLSRATLLNADGEGKFQNRKHEWFAEDGMTVIKTITTTLYYDSDGVFVEEN